MAERDVFYSTILKIVFLPTASDCGTIWVALSPGIKQHNYTYNTLNAIMGYNYNIGVIGLLYPPDLVNFCAASNFSIKKREGLCLILEYSYHM